MARPIYNPQKALLVERPPTGERWIHELKLDGFRMGILIRGRSVQIVSRRGTDYTEEFPEITATAAKLPCKSALLDGEVVVLDDHGVSNFQRLQQLGTSRRGLTYFAFDLLLLDGEPLTAAPLEERKRRLKKLLGSRSRILRYTPHFEKPGEQVFHHACALGAEGIVSKLRDAPYRAGARSADWQKAKCVKRQEFVVGGFTDPEGSRVGIGSLLIGYHEGTALRFAGKVGTGTGWGDAFGRKLRRQLERIEIRQTPFDPPPTGWLGKHAHWVKPKLVAEVEFTEWTTDGSVRHPSLQGFRGDKRPAEVVRERAVPSPSAEAARKLAPKPATDPPPRLVFPRTHTTTEDLVALYSDIMDWALPHAEGRPLTLVRMRAPITREDALRSQAKFVHHTARDQHFVPDEVPRMRIPEKRKLGEYCYVTGAETLLALIRSGVVEWHVWNARIENIERPDRVVFDIDPGEGVTWRGVVAAARRVRRILEDHDLESWVKTTGGKGLHVVAPFRPEHDWDSVFEFSHAVALEVVREEPERYTASFDKAQRRARILIDYKRNYRTSIAVAGFSPRAKPNGAIAIPVSWKDISRLEASDVTTVENIRGRLARRRLDPWKDYWTSRQRLRIP